MKCGKTFVGKHYCTEPTLIPGMITEKAYAPPSPPLTIERLRELLENVAWALKYGHFIPQTDTADLQRLIEVEIEKQEELK
jgi:hypothetical protein